MRQHSGGIVRRRARRACRLFEIALLAKRGAALREALAFTLDPGDPRSPLRNLGFGHAPFRFDPGVIGSGLGQRKLGGAACAFHILQLGGQRRARLFIGFQRGFAFGQFAFQPRQRFCRVAGQPVRFAAVLFQPRALAVKVCQPLFRRFKLAGERRHAVAMRTGIVTPVGQRITGLRQRFSAGRLRRLRGSARLLGAGYPIFRCFRL